jgi:hypothetical protein
MPSVRRLTAILAADVAGYSRLMGADEEGTHERLQAYSGNGSIQRSPSAPGPIVNNTGDGGLAGSALRRGSPAQDMIGVQLGSATVTPVPGSKAHLMADPFTLHIYVPSGDPEGLRIVDRTHGPARGYIFPRGDWAEVKARPELARPGVYVLLGYEEDELKNERTVAYIGQTDNLRDRIDGHDLKKDWWEKAALFLSANDDLDRAQTAWLEWELIRRAALVNRCRRENRTEPGEPNLIEREKADIRAFLNELLRIMPVMGITIFETLKVPSPAARDAAGLTPEPRDIRDTIIVSAQPDNFERVFLGQNAWWAIRVAEKYRPNLKWIAAYQSHPVSAATHLAEIDHFEPYGDAGKLKAVFKGPATLLERPIPRGDAPPGAMFGSRYTTRAALLSATTMKDFIR